MDIEKTDFSSDGKGTAAASACSICLELVLDHGRRSTAKLQCGHEFHLGEQFLSSSLHDQLLLPHPVPLLSVFFFFFFWDEFEIEAICWNTEFLWLDSSILPRSVFLLKFSVVLWWLVEDCNLTSRRILFSKDSTFIKFSISFRFYLCLDWRSNNHIWLRWSCKLVIYLAGYQCFWYGNFMFAEWLCVDRKIAVMAYFLLAHQFVL